MYRPHVIGPKFLWGRRINRTTAVCLIAALTVGGSLVGFPGQYVSSASAQPVSSTEVNADVSDDSRVIFQTFSLYMPYDQDMYTTLQSELEKFSSYGVTDLWLPPAYRSFDQARYMEGYSIADRYDLGEFDQGPSYVDGQAVDTQATKYGTSDELKDLVASAHENGMSAQLDLVPNQLLGLSTRHAVKVRRVDANGDPFVVDGEEQIDGEIYLAYTEGGGEGQATYGILNTDNEYAQDLDGDGDYDSYWTTEDFNGTSLQGQGISRALSASAANTAAGDNLADGTYFRFSSDDPEVTTIPSSWLGISNALSSGLLNVVDTYLAADGWYCYQDCDTAYDQKWTPYLVNDLDFQTWVVENWSDLSSRYAPDSAGAPEATAEGLVALGSGVVSNLLNEYLSVTAGYNIESEQPSLVNDVSGIDDDDQFLFLDENGDLISDGLNMNFNGNNEFLVGYDVDNSNAEVQAETTHWMEWLLDTYDFDGFRIDAASHMTTTVLEDAAEVVANAEENAGSAGKLSYIESYSSDQIGYENSIENAQLVYDTRLYYTLSNVLGAKVGDRDSALNLARNSYVANREELTDEDSVVPNWSFVTNHDQEKNLVNRIIMDQLGIEEGDDDPSFEEAYSDEVEQAALEAYNADIQKVDKQYAPYNVASSYAYLLTSKGTVPTIYYGDLYQTDAAYMSTESIYYDSIITALEVRSAFASGDQYVYGYETNTSSVSGEDLIASVRSGTSRDTGVATVIGTDPAINTTVTIPMGSDHAYQEYRDATGNNSLTYFTDGDGNLTVHVQGESTNVTSGALAMWVPVTGLSEMTSSTPTITGYANAGETLTVETGSWTPGTSLHIQWYADGVAIPGGTNSKLRLWWKDRGKKITVSVTGTLRGYETTTETSTAVTVGKLEAPWKIAWSGSQKVGSTLKVTPKGWYSSNGVTVAYQWKRGNTYIAGATGSSYRVTAADAGQQITVKITGSRDGYTSTTVYKDFTIRALPVLEAPWKISWSGSQRVGSTLSVVPRGWYSSNGVSVSYQWKRGNTYIAGATGSSYRVTAADAGQQITVKITGTKSGYSSATVYQTFTIRAN